MSMTTCLLDSAISRGSGSPSLPASPTLVALTTMSADSFESSGELIASTCSAQPAALADPCDGCAIPLMIRSRLKRKARSGLRLAMVRLRAPASTAQKAAARAAPPAPRSSTRAPASFAPVPSSARRKPRASVFQPPILSGAWWARQFTAPIWRASWSRRSTKGITLSLCGRVTETPFNSPERTRSIIPFKSEAGTRSAAYAPTIPSSEKSHWNRRGESECSTGSPITAYWFAGDTSQLLSTPVLVRRGRLDAHGPGGELREQIEVPGKGDVRPLRALDNGFAVRREPRQGEAHRDPMVAHGVDPRGAKSGRTLDQQSIVELVNFGAHRGQALRHLCEPVGFLEAQLARAADDGGPPRLGGDCAQQRNLVDERGNFPSEDLGAAQLHPAARAQGGDRISGALALRLHFHRRPHSLEHAQKSGAGRVNVHAAHLDFAGAHHQQRAD